MSGAIANAMRLQALRAARGKISSRIGIITGYDPDKYTIKATIQPEGIKTGFIPLAAAWVGNGWGIFFGPQIGNKVKLNFVDGDLTAAIAELQLYDANNVPPAGSVSSGEFMVAHKSGSLLKFTNDGKVQLTSHADLNIAVGGNLTASVTGDINLNANNKNAEFTVSKLKVNGDFEVTGASTFDGDVDVDATLTGTTIVTDAGIDLDKHHTSGVTPGTGISEVPVV